MDWKTFIAELVKALAWPGLIGVGLFTYHRAILNLLAALIRMLKRAQSLKYGDLVLATKSVNEAIAAKETEAESAALALTQPNTSPADRERLAAELREALEESARLRSALDSLQASTQEAATSKFSPATRHRARYSLLSHVISTLGVARILELGEKPDVDELSTQVNAAITEARMPGNKTIGFSDPEMQANQESGLLDSKERITVNGLRQLYKHAKSSANKPYF